MKAAVAWFGHNPVAANLLMVMIILSGLVALFRMPLKSFPDIDANIIKVTVRYLGAAPEEVEQGVCIRIEEELEGIEDVKKITSRANEGLCTLNVELLEEADSSMALDDVKNRVDSISTLPLETEKPIITLLSPIRPVMDIAITGSGDEKTLKILGQQVRDDIAALPRVTQVSLLNTRPYEISIEVRESSLRRNGLSFEQLAAAVRRGSLDLPGGAIKTGGGEILLRTKGQAYWGAEFEKLVIVTRADGTRLYLRDVADVIDGFEDTDQMLRFDGYPAAIIRVSRIGDQDILEIIESVTAYLDESSSHLPAGVKLTIWNDGSKLLQDRLDTLINSARQGFLMVLLLLAMFLRPRLAFWVSFGVPVAFLGAMILIFLLGLSIDAISMFGFILVLGILVDDAIVVGENVHSTQLASLKNGKPNLLEDAIKATRQVAVPVTFGVLTTFAAFMPLLMGPGVIGQIQSIIATVVMCCLTFSLIESQLILPAHLGHQIADSIEAEIGLLMIPIGAIVLLQFADDGRSFIGLAVICTSVLLALHVLGVSTPVARQLSAWQKHFSTNLETLIHVRFRSLADSAIQSRYVTVSISLVALISAIAILGSGRLPFSFFPPLASDQVIAQLTMPLGTSAVVTNKAVLLLESTAQNVQRQLADEFPDAPPVTHILSAVGNHPTSSGGSGPSAAANVSSAGGHLGEVTMQLTPSQSRTLKTRDIAKIWREQVGAIPDAIELKFKTSLFTVGNAIDIQLEGDDLNELKVVAVKLRQKLAEYPGVIDISDSFRPGKQEIKLNILPEGEALGLSLAILARQMRQAFYGEEVQRIQRGRDDVRVMVRYTEEERKSLSTLDAMRIRTPDGFEVPFATVARGDFGQGYSSIKRADRKRVVNVVADVDRTQITANEVLADLRKGKIEAILRDFPRVTYALEGEQKEQAESISSLIPLFFLALILIYALLAVPLKSYLQPLVIMSVVPFAFVGATWGHLIMQTFGYVSGLAMMSVLGFIAASGVVVNSSLVLVYSINAHRTADLSVHDAVLGAVVSRCRPIILTSLTTFVGLLPLMLNKSVQAQFLVPMAISLAFGVMFATLVTLLVVPSGYLIMEDFKASIQRLAGVVSGFVRQD